MVIDRKEIVHRDIHEVEFTVHETWSEQVIVINYIAEGIIMVIGMDVTNAWER